MKGIVCTRYGPPDVLQLKEIEKPSSKENEVLIRIHTTTVTAGDCGLRSLKSPLLSQPLVRMGFGFRGPRKKILGQELAGEIESIGSAVKLFRKGDQVFCLDRLPSRRLCRVHMPA
jgi:NADPH:quinone reductase-like Zn-dependent oxidoreductase